MNEIQRAENPTAELVRGLMRDRTILVNRLDKCERVWTDYEKYRKEVLNDIAAIDSIAQLAITAHHQIELLKSGIHPDITK